MYKLEDNRLAEHKISSLGTSVDVGDQGNQPPEPPEPGDIGTPQEGPSRGKGNQGNQPSKPPTPLKEPSSKEPKVLAGSKDPQVEIDEVKVQRFEQESMTESVKHAIISLVVTCTGVVT